MSKERLYWLGRYARDQKPDLIVFIGDFETFDSVSYHEAPDTIKGKYKPVFAEDIESLKEARAAFHKGLKGHKCPIHVTLGNHEERVPKWENNHPETAGVLVKQMRDAFGDWKLHPYGEYFMCKGVGFIHVPINEMGREYGGKTAEQRIANDATFDIVFGHSHKRRDFLAPKLGKNNSVRILNLGSALPDGVIENYAKISSTGWSYGCFLLDIYNKRIQDTQFITMKTLKEKYE